MRKPLIDSSLSNEEKVKKLELVVERLSRRSRKQTSVLMTPYPLSSCLIGDVNGEILRYLFCCSGALTKGGIFLNIKPKTDAFVTLSIANEFGGTSKTYPVVRRNLVFEPEIEINTWDRLTVTFSSVEPEKESDKITEVWFALLWVPSVKEADVKNFLIDELDNA